MIFVKSFPALMVAILFIATISSVAGFTEEELYVAKSTADETEKCPTFNIGSTWIDQEPGISVLH
ncbi:hypothetical protein KEM48_007401 [Puccinia striiformis f. sp. tritici PST-130]|uniref:Uncharacterized protein n=1 Tax=Puccinia striiformis f. sp. tritici PST-78 TaxID=1165861 RepID=A0A0L0VEY0_9BASI|nr:hypothetical protein H4Q26_007460 [Puccinia striiformis f. sp. tritici PST-130]KAI9622091.1 hypothetical protein KEM48_007401 [Puccinia striiformis f. sp. tritici PST-130]KNE97756.1 hypothetical protein PSTG_08975 [Puccinia striiformis f. sp. tritici PST-78]